MKLSELFEATYTDAQNNEQPDRRAGGEGADRYFLQRRRKLFDIVKGNTSVPETSKLKALELVKRVETTDALLELEDKLRAHKIIS